MNLMMVGLSNHRVDCPIHLGRWIGRLVESSRLLAGSPSVLLNQLGQPSREFQ